MQYAPQPHEPLPCAHAQALRLRARSGEKLPEGLSGLEARVWIMGAAERIEMRKGEAS